MSQAQRILDYMLAGNRITPVESLELFGCFRLGARIWDLKKLGHKIEDELVDVVKRDGTTAHVSAYWIEPKLVQSGLSFQERIDGKEGEAQAESEGEKGKEERRPDNIERAREGVDLSAQESAAGISCA